MIPGAIARSLKARSVRLPLSWRPTTPPMPTPVPLSRKRIQTIAQINELLPQADVGNIGHPDLVRARQVHVPRQIRKEPVGVARIRRKDKAPLCRHSRLSSRISRNTRL